MNLPARPPGQVLVIGANRVGLEVAAQLRQRGAVVLVADLDQRNLAKAEAHGFAVQVADYTDDDELARLGIGSTVTTLFTLLPDDATNVFLVISARGLAPKLPIVSVTGSPDAAMRLLAAGATKVIDPYEISGRKLYEMIRRPYLAELLETTVFGQENLNIAELEVTAGSFLDGHCLDRLELQEQYNLVVLGVVDREKGDAFIFATRGETHCMDPGDVLVAIGPREELDRLRRDLAGA